MCFWSRIRIWFHRGFGFGPGFGFCVFDFGSGFGFILDLVSVPDSVSVQSKNLQVSFGLCFGFKSKLFKFRVAFAFSAGNRIRAQRKNRVDKECSNKPR